MSFVRLYGRVLDQLGARPPHWLVPGDRQRRAWPSRCSPSRCCSAASSMCWPARRPIRRRRTGRICGCCFLPGSCFGLFTIVCATTVALFADRLAHRRRLAVLTSYFEHVLQLPLAYHGEVHSGRLMKIMLQGTDTLWAFLARAFSANISRRSCRWSSWCRWRSRSIGGWPVLLIVLCVLFAVFTALVLRKTETLQNTVQDASLGPRRARVRRARQHRAGAELRARRIGGARAPVGQ